MPIRAMASTIGKLRSRYSVVIVGSGYGGSVLAARLSEGHEAPEGICLLERGLELSPGEFPDRVRNAPRHIQLSTERWRFGSKSALFDFRLGSDVNVLVGCGLGGGSLINAGVSLPAPDAAFATGWPRGLNRATLDPYYQRARGVLGATTTPRAHSLGKFKALQRSAGALGMSVAPAPINVTFSPAGSGPTAPVGAEQPPCTLCGDCVSGCNVGAKNTLVMNYLPMAHRNGVEVFTGIGVRSIQRGTGKFRNQWLVSAVRPWDRHRRSPTTTIVADTVILAAGTLGSTEILLRSRQLGLSLSDQLGAHFSANGDVLGFAFDGRSPVHAIAGGMRGVRHSAVGPTITGMVTVPWKKDGQTKMILLEEGAVPAVLAPLVPLAFASTAIMRRRWPLLKALGGPYSGALKRTLPYLMMYPDDDGGVLTLREDRLRVEWPDHAGRPAYQAHKDLLRRAAEQGLEATLYRQPGVDGVYSKLTTVHPLGGCVMAETAEQGVVDADCRVFGGPSGDKVHDGLYVCDGSIIPVALGVNPLLTISALAERLADAMAGSGSSTGASPP